MAGKVVLVVLDAVGLPTLNYLLDKYRGRVGLPWFAAHGLGQLVEPRHKHLFDGAQAPNVAVAAFSIDQASHTADSVMGHREMVGVIDHRSFDLFPNGFDPLFVGQLQQHIGRRVMFNQMAGGEEVIKQNAVAHAATGEPILYASICDPVMQIAMHEDVIPVAEQHRIGEVAFELAIEMGVRITRVITRAFVDGPADEQGNLQYKRTANRHDVVMPIGHDTLVEVLRRNGVWCCSVGKPADLLRTDFDLEVKLNKPSDLSPGLDARFVSPKQADTNPYTLQGVVNVLRRLRADPQEGAFVFANFVDTDSVFGHTQDVQGSVQSLMETDRQMHRITELMDPGDLLIVTADHGMRHAGNYGYHNKEPLPLIMVHIGAAHLRPVQRWPLDPNLGLTEVALRIAAYFGCAETCTREGISHIRD